MSNHTANRSYYRPLRWILPLAFLVVLAAACTATAPAASYTAPYVPASPTAPAPVGPAASFGEGTYVAGEDIAPGRYRSAGVAESSIPMCYFDVTSPTGAFVDQGVTTAGPSRLTVKAGQTVKTSGCAPWVRP